MRALLATYGRELRAYFLSPLAYVILFFFLLVNGVIFSVIISFLNDPRYPAGRPFDALFSISWLLLLFVVPLVTMRLLAEERRSGSIEVLMTAPVSAGQVVTGKFLAALTFVAFLWAPTVLYALLVGRWSDVDWGIVGAGYLGILLIASFFLSLGVLASALTRNQIVSAVIAFAFMLVVFFVASLSELVTATWLQETVTYASVLDHLSEFSRGIVDTRRLVFYLSGTFFFLFTASRALDDRKWR